MLTQAAVLWEAHSDWKVEEVELDPPKETEVLVRLAASGLCHSEEHHLSGDVPFAAPLIGGHEGAGVVEAVGPGVTSVEVGDHVVFSSIPSCGRCPSCARGRHNLCDWGQFLSQGLQLLDHTSRHHVGGVDANLSCLIGTHARHTVASEASVLKIEKDIPLELACIVGCGVPTGWGSAVYTGEVGPGDDVAVVGVGGLGMSAVQGARFAGARRIFAVDPLEWKREMALELGATHAAPGITEAFELVREVTWGRMCNQVILTMGVGRGDLMADVMRLVAKRGRVVVTNIHPAGETEVRLSLLDLASYEKQIVGCIFGSVNSRFDIPRLLDYYREGRLDLKSMVTKTYPLEEVNRGYQDMRDGRTLRGVLVM
ncbi:MAG: NDMA-dependent alcohol dehydrogenase [Candidatus Dormibacteraeota bacterium]|nr:NDMA-dependent alcohol dehydrogenase [Candidatus Dormibacteraeota bacterium]